MSRSKPPLTAVNCCMNTGVGLVSTFGSACNLAFGSFGKHSSIKIGHEIFSTATLSSSADLRRAFDSYR